MKMMVKQAASMGVVQVIEGRSLLENIGENCLPHEALHTRPEGPEGHGLDVGTA